MPGAVPHGGFGSPVSEVGPVPPEKVGLGGGSSEDLLGARSPPLWVLMCIHLTTLSRFLLEDDVLVGLGTLPL